MDEKTLQFMSDYVRGQISGEKSIIVKFKDQQTVVKCCSVRKLLQKLTDMQWINKKSHFYFQSNEQMLQDDDGNDLDLEAEGMLEDFGITENMSIELISNISPPNQPNIGGFYTFKYKVEGTCVAKQHNAYSIRDKQGKVHVVYKHCIETFE